MSDQTGRPSNDAIVQALMAGVNVRYGARLGPEELANVTDNMAQLVGAIETLRRFPLTNADEPDFVFRAYRREG